MNLNLCLFQSPKLKVFEPKIVQSKIVTWISCFSNYDPYKYLDYLRNAKLCKELPFISRIIHLPKVEKFGPSTCLIKILQFFFSKLEILIQ